MKSLGKIFLVFFISSQALFANVTASVDATNVSYSDVVRYNLTINGDDIKKPDIFSLCGEDVVGTSSSKSIQIVNGDYQKSYVLSYQFVAEKTCTIEPQSIEVDGKTYQTQPIDISVSKHVSSINDDFSLQLSTQKDELYVGEEFELNVLFRQRKSVQVADNRFVKPDFKGFWVKGEPRQEALDAPSFNVTKIIYKLVPQRAGELTIEPLRIGIASRVNSRNYFGGMFQDVKWKNYFSNDLKINVKALPDDVSIVGDLSIQAVADKVSINPNEAVNVTIKVLGEGNLEDIESFKPYIDGVSIFDEKIEVKDNKLSQKITFVADSDFTIPVFSLKVFNPTTKETKTIQTQAMNIHVNSSSVEKEKIIVQREDKTTSKKAIKQEVPSQDIEINILLAVGLFVAGVLFGILLMLARPFIRFKAKKKFNYRDERMLLVRLLPFKHKEDVSEIVETLENNLYQEEKKPLDKKHLKQVMKKYEIN